MKEHRQASRLRRVISFTAGAALVSLLLLSAGEAFLRWFPPPDFRPYLGDASALRGPYRSDPVYGVQYRSWQAFEDDNRQRLEIYRPLFTTASPRCWGMFGNSFVQMQGMLADTALAQLPDRVIFNLARNEPLLVRAAQIELLLSHGLKPERIFFVLLPHDGASLALHSASQTHASKDGGIVYRPRLSDGPLDLALTNSRLALLAWVRAGRHHAVPGFSASSLNHDIDPRVLSELRHLITLLSDSGRRHGVPITVVLIPNHEQITRGVSFGFQDRLTPVCKEACLDVCDVRTAFLNADDKPGLFIPDKHFSDRGNRILLDAMLAHLRQQNPDAGKVAHGGPRP